MARFRQSSALTDLFEIAAKLPWKVSLAFAAISLLALHLLAAGFFSMPTVTDPTHLGGVVIHQYIHAGAFFLQFVIPPAFLIGATVSYFKRSQSIRLFDETRNAQGPAVASLTWQQFETLVAEAFRRLGFAVTEKGGAAADGGVDLILIRGTERFLVQCKQWRAQQVPVTTVRELYGVMAAQQAAGGYVVTSGRFTRDTVDFAQGRNIELIDGQALRMLLSGADKLASVSKTAPFANSTISSKPMCPQCHEPMIVGVAKRGQNPGSEFWGCPRYPKCRATRPKT
jgi:restriction system protein